MNHTHEKANHNRIEILYAKAIQNSNPEQAEEGLRQARNQVTEYLETTPNPEQFNNLLVKINQSF